MCSAHAHRGAVCARAAFSRLAVVLLGRERQMFFTASTIKFTATSLGSTAVFITRW